VWHEQRTEVGVSKISLARLEHCIVCPPFLHFNFPNHYDSSHSTSSVAADNSSTILAGNIFSLNVESRIWN
jgi:hypothetical protein